MAANLRQAPANLKHFRSMLDFTPAQLKNVVASAIALKKVRAQDRDSMTLSSARSIRINPNVPVHWRHIVVVSGL